MSNPTVRDTLLPCPFCGGKPIERLGAIHCDDCGACPISQAKDTPEQNREAWNTRHESARAQQAAQPDMTTLDVLKQAREALTWLCVREVHYDVDVRQAPNLTENAWERADAVLAAVAAEIKRMEGIRREAQPDKAEVVERVARACSRFVNGIEYEDERYDYLPAYVQEKYRRQAAFALSALPQRDDGLVEELPDAAIIAALEASIKFREERGIDDVQPDSPGGVAVEMVRVVYRAMRPFLLAKAAPTKAGAA